MRSARGAPIRPRRRARWSGIDAGLLEPQVLRVRMPPDGEQQVAAFGERRTLLAGQPDGDALTLLLQFHAGERLPGDVRPRAPVADLDDGGVEDLAAPP